MGEPPPSRGKVPPWGPESPGLGDPGSRVPGLGDPGFRVPGRGVPINSRPSVPGRLNLGGEIGSEMGGEIGGVGYGVFSLRGPGPGIKKAPPKYHYQTPPLSLAKFQSPGGGL